ncbi:Urease accessory protein UreD [Kerstersia similis]
MNLTGSANLSAIPDRTPNRQCWLLFRVGTLSRLKELQRGKVYMNSVQYFSELEGEPLTGLRRDFLEKNYLKLHSRKTAEKVSEIFLNIGGKEISLGDDATMHLDLPNPSNIFIFCMSALADGPNGKIPGELHGEVLLSSRFMELGSHLMIIRNNAEFSKRLSKAIRSNPHLYNSDFFEGGHGQVEYIDMANHSGLVGLFRKDIEFAWQREYRICLGAKTEALNPKGALELDIGDINDITEILPTDKMISSPIKLRRGIIKIVDGVATHQYVEDHQTREN